MKKKFKHNKKACRIKSQPFSLIYVGYNPDHKQLQYTFIKVRRFSLTK